MARQLLRPLVVVLSLFALAFPAVAQNNERDRDTWTASTNAVDISGLVRFAGSTGPAVGVRVQLERIGGGVIDQMLTDGRGRFRFAALPRGQYIVNVSAPCYLSARQQVELVVIFRAYQDFELKPDNSSPGCRAGDSAAAGVIDARVPVKAREQFEKGRQALAKGKAEEGVAHLQKAVQIYPEFFEAYMLLASAHTEARRLDKAEESLGRASQINPQSSAALVSLGEIRRRQKKYAEAEKPLLAALKLDDESWQCHLALGRVYLETDDVRKAAQHIGRTLLLKPDFAEGHLLGGNILLRVGQPERALAEYQEYLRLAPSGEYVAQAEELVRKLEKAIAEKKKQ